MIMPVMISVMMINRRILIWISNIVQVDKCCQSSVDYLDYPIALFDWCYIIHTEAISEVAMWEIKIRMERDVTLYCQIPTPSAPFLLSATI